MNSASSTSLEYGLKPKRSWKRIIFKVSVVLGIIAAIVATLVLIFLGGFIRSILATRALESRLATPQVSGPAGIALAKLCQSDPSIYGDSSGFFQAWIPPDLAKLGACSVRTATVDTAAVEFGGGFHHFGYALTLDKSASDATTNQWVIELYSEDSAPKTLATFPLAKTEHFGLDEVVQFTIAEYRRRASMGIRADDVRSRLAFLLERNQQPLAVQSIRDFSANFPHDWLDALLAFMIDHPTDPYAGKRLDAWAAEENDFTTWLYAAYGYSAAGDMNDADRCVKNAMRHPFIDPIWVDGNARYRGSAMCLRLYQAGKYTTCIALCDVLLSYTDSQAYRQPEIANLRSLAQSAIAHPSENPGEAGAIQDGFDPLKEIDLAKLRSAPAATAPAALSN